MNFTVGCNQILKCKIHPREQIICGCGEISCSDYPFFCSLCLQDAFQLSLHASHGNQIKTIEEVVYNLSKQVKETYTQIQTNFKETLSKNENESIIKSFNEPDEHLNSIGRFIIGQKNSIETDYKQILDEMEQTLKLTQLNMFDRLDFFFETYKQNFLALKDIVKPLDIMIKKTKYYANQNNLTNKLACSSHQGRINLISQIKQNLMQSKNICSGDKIQKTEKIITSFAELNKALDQLPSYQNDKVSKLSEDLVKTYQQSLIQSLNIPECKIIDLSFPYQTTRKEEEQIIFPQFNMNIEESFQHTRTSVKDEEHAELSSRKGEPVDNDVVSFKQVDKLPLEFLQDCQLKDCRLISHLSINQLISKPQGRKFKIKKKLTLDIYISCISLVTQNLLAIGSKDGSVKLLDLTTNKVSFYPNAFITHFDEVICIQPLMNQKTSSAGEKGIRLASSSLDTNIIIWTLGENNIAYPERKLVSFHNPIIRMIDLEDGSHLAGADTQGDIFIINYHDNRVLHSFKAKKPTTIVEFFYINELRKFITVSNTNEISVYNLIFKQMQVFSLANRIYDKSSQLLTSCDQESYTQGPNIGQITCCCPIINYESIYLCYGNSKGNLIIQDVKKNLIIFNQNQFKSQVIDLALLSAMPDPKAKKTGFVLLGLADQDIKLRGLILANQKYQILDQFGELLEECLASKAKYLIQVQQSPEGKVSIITLNKSQKDICVLDLI